MADGDTAVLEEQPAVVPGEGQLGRLLHHDVRNRAYPTRAVLFAADAPLVNKIHWRRHVYNQGGESSCTSQAAAGVLATSPFRMMLARTNLTSYDEPPERFELYREAQRNDPWDGEEPAYFGTSTDAPYKVLRAHGQISAWRWNFSLDDTLRCLSHHGPCSIGIDWLEGYDHPDADGFILPTGAVRGGHAVELYGVDVTRGFVRGVNSWGPSWGINGRFKMSFDTLRQALEASGESCTVTL